MFETEARWLYAALDRYAPERLSPLLNLGSSTAAFREQTQPWTEQGLFRPLRDRGVEIVHVDRRDEAGIDLRADLTDPADLPQLHALRPRALLCCNLLEHVTEPDRLARHCLDILPKSGLAFVTAPFSYPYHRDPIDTMYRPSPVELEALFAGARLLDSRNHRRRYVLSRRCPPTPVDPVASCRAFPGAICVARKMEALDGEALLAGGRISHHLRRVREIVTAAARRLVDRARRWRTGAAPALRSSIVRAPG